ncbi:group II intron maturase-specific domain-containing protein [Candidatus Mycobacterium methanotrophicum]|nr:group II intron maturase-specific domain-containing protein [Candidatus Mycobacterium methanotrophicum]
MRKVKMISRQVSTSQPIDELLRRLNVTLRGWAGLSTATMMGPP